jgi:hypothetical protein
MPNGKPCERCSEAERIEGERYCKKCRKIIIAPIRAAASKPFGVRDIHGKGSELVGRKCRSTRITEYLPDDGDDHK